jgi:hypothetical protein
MSLLKTLSSLRKWGNCPAEMRGQRERSGSLFSYVSIEERIPATHPLRRIWKLADQALDREHERLSWRSAVSAQSPPGGGI